MWRAARGGKRLAGTCSQVQGGVWETLGDWGGTIGAWKMRKCPCDTPVGSAVGDVSMDTLMHSTGHLMETWRVGEGVVILSSVGEG